MADTLRIVAVRPNGDGEQLGTITFGDGTLTGDTALASDQIDMLRRRTKLGDTVLFERLNSEGWSNGQIVIKP